MMPFVQPYRRRGESATDFHVRYMEACQCYRRRSERLARCMSLLLIFCEVTALVALIFIAKAFK